VRSEAPKADVAEQDVLGVDQRVWIRRGVRSDKLAASARRHRSDGSVEPLPELEHLSLRLEREADLAPGVHLARIVRDREHGAILPRNGRRTLSGRRVNGGDRAAACGGQDPLDTISRPYSSTARPCARAFS
jgi:hypothetical protein